MREGAQCSVKLGTGVLRADLNTDARLALGHDGVEESSHIDPQFEQPTGYISAAAVVVTIPVVILVLLFQRRIVAGLTNGAVKG